MTFLRKVAKIFGTMPESSVTTPKFSQGKGTGKKNVSYLLISYVICGIH